MLGFCIVFQVNQIGVSRIGCFGNCISLIVDGRFRASACTTTTDDDFFLVVIVAVVDNLVRGGVGKKWGEGEFVCLSV